MDQKLGRDPNGVAVFGGIVRRFVQLSKNENSMRKILIRGGCLAQRCGGAERLVIAGGSILQTSSDEGRF